MRNFRPSLFGWLIFSVFCLALSGLSGMIDAQEEVTETPTAEPSVTPTPTPTPFALTIFRDTDTFTLYAPTQGEISLVGFTFAVSDKIYALENFGSFRGLPFDRLPTPICFRLARSGSSSPLPLECTSALILTQMLSNADIFWYDAVLVQDFVVLIQRDGETQGICASGQAACEISFTSGEATPTPTITETLSSTLTVTSTALITSSATETAYCQGVIKAVNSSQIINSVYSTYSTRSAHRPAVRVGDLILVTERHEENQIIWFRITDRDGNELGWIENRYVPTC